MHVHAWPGAAHFFSHLIMAQTCLPFACRHSTREAAPRFEAALAAWEGAAAAVLQREALLSQLLQGACMRSMAWKLHVACWVHAGVECKYAVGAGTHRASLLPAHAAVRQALDEAAKHVAAAAAASAADQQAAHRVGVLFVETGLSSQAVTQRRSGNGFRNGGASQAHHLPPPPSVSTAEGAQLMWAFMVATQQVGVWLLGGSHGGMSAVRIEAMALWPLPATGMRCGHPNRPLYPPLLGCWHAG